MVSKKEIILIFDFGSQYTHLIKSRLQDVGAYSVIVPADICHKDWITNIENNNFQVKGLILSGSAASVKTNSILFDQTWLESGTPVLGICYGHQLLAKIKGGQVKKEKSEYGSSQISIIHKNALFDGVTNNSIVWMSHGDTVMQLPKGYEILASSEYTPITAYKKIGSNLFGVQFHPEVSHTIQGDIILSNFSFKICKIKKKLKWTPKIFVDQAILSIKSRVRESKVIVAVSGGVDSLTMTALLKKALRKSQIIAIYVDSGLMPKETQSEVVLFCRKFDIKLEVVNESDRFFNALKSEIKPDKKCKIIGKTFIEIFEEIAKKYNTKIVAQGTIWSDVVESGVTKFSSQIKPHHNVGGLPNHLNVELLEPLRDLFKDKVRLVANFLNLPDEAVFKKVFPGPGFAIRVQGEVTRSKVELVRKATKIIEETLQNSPVKNDIWMSFAILINVPSLGIKGDEHQKYNKAIVVRVVESINSMTANFSLKALPYLKTISKRIVDEVGVGRVVYDITDKPPATIEWQ